MYVILTLESTLTKKKLQQSIICNLSTIFNQDYFKHKNSPAKLK